MAGTWKVHIRESGQWDLVYLTHVKKAALFKLYAEHQHSLSQGGAGGHTTPSSNSSQIVINYGADIRDNSAKSLPVNI